MSRPKRKKAQKGSRKRMSKPGVFRRPKLITSVDVATGAAVLVVCDQCNWQQVSMHAEPQEIHLGGLFYAGCRFCGNATGRYA